MEIKLTIVCGPTTCAESPGVFCRYLNSRIDGYAPRCVLFSADIADESGGADGWLQRCPECVSAGSRSLIGENSHG